MLQTPKDFKSFDEDHALNRLHFLTRLHF